MKEQIKAADLTQEDYLRFPFTWWQKNALYIIGAGLLVIILSTLFFTL